MCNRDLGDEIANHHYRGIQMDDFEAAALSQLLAIAKIHRVGHKAGIRLFLIAKVPKFLRSTESVY